jgi:catechol 2,3-dioxygenase-like lactoylglutathione lyase family enzyme
MQNMVTMLMVSNMGRSVAFYRDTLELKLRFQTPDWSEFDMGTTTLALHGGALAASWKGEKQEPVVGGVLPLDSPWRTWTECTKN